MSILTMNQNVFSSVFVGKKVSKEVKRAIGAELIVPVSAIAYSAIVAADKASRGEHFRFEIETVFFGIPVGVTIQ